MAGVTVASIIVLFSLPLGVIGDAVGVGVGQLVTEALRKPNRHFVAYEYLQFVLQASPNFKHKHSPRFTIHGLWPSNFSHRVENCRSYKLQQFKTEVSPRLQNMLSQSWPNLKRRDNDGFWTHEYKAHGSCSNLKARDYFTTAENLYHNLRPNLSLLLHQIRLPGSNEVDATRYLNDIREANEGNIPRLWCKSSGAHTVLDEVVICYDNNPANPVVIPCPVNRVLNLWRDCHPGLISYPI